MATQTGSIDLKAAKNAHDDASKYITKIDDSGIKVHSYNDTTQQADTSNYAKINASGLEVVNNGKSVASYGSSARIGISDGTQSYMALDYHSMQMIDKEGDTYFHVSDLRDAAGVATINDAFYCDGTSNQTFTLSFLGSNHVVLKKGTSGWVTVSSSEYSISGRTLSFNGSPSGLRIVSYTTSSQEAKVFTFGQRGTIYQLLGAMSFAAGYGVEAVGAYSSAFNIKTIAIGDASHAEGAETIANGRASHAEGGNTTATGICSHAEGKETKAENEGAHAEGNNTYAWGAASHAEGDGTDAGSKGAHAEGISTKAWANGAHAQNIGTKATAQAQTAIGKYNIMDGQYALIIGNGTSDNARSDALEVDWGGDVFLALDTNAGSGTDHDLYAAITALGWGSDVIV